MSTFQYAKKNAKTLFEFIKILSTGFFKYGLVGSADIMGILDGGRLLCIEIKSGSARQSKVQKNFGAMVTKFGGVYIVARSAEEALEKVTAALKGY